MSGVQQTKPAETVSGTTSRITTSGDIVQSGDPSTNPDASITEKLKGDVAGAVKGTIGSMQAATGLVVRNDEMHNKGLEKMQEEDQRMAAKHGVMPVGSDRRETKVDAAPPRPEQDLRQ